MPSDVSTPSRTARDPPRRSIDRRALAGRAARALATPVRAVGFWGAVLLPAAYLPLLAGGLSGDRAGLFALLVGCHALALVVGHRHGDDG
jgi:hypothetical protein